MTPTKIQILNLALAYLQQSPVNETTKNPKIEALSNIYDVLKLKCLQQNVWSFALKTARLSRLTDASDYPNYLYMYPLPNDCLLVFQLYAGAYQTQTNYQLIGDKIYSNWPELSLLYVFPQIENNWSVSFVNYVALIVAAQGCMLFTQDKTLAASLVSAAEQAFIDASSADGFNHPSYVIQNYPLITARVGG